MNLALIVLNYNDYETTIKYINSIKDYRTINYIIVVDNYSTNNSYNILKEYESDKIKAIRTEKKGG